MSNQGIALLVDFVLCCVLKLTIIITNIYCYDTVNFEIFQV